MGDSGDPFVRNPNAAVQARAETNNRADVLQLKLMGQSHPTGLTNNLLKLFEPRPPLEYKPPPEKRKCPPYTGMALFVSNFAEPGDPEYAPPKPVVETPAQKKERIQKSRLEKGVEKAAEDFKKYDPNNDPNASGDPYKTLFVSRLNYESSESKIKREFESYGPIKRVQLVTDQLTNKPRGYGFIEYMHTRDMKAAYKQADGQKIDGRRVLVDVERGRTVPNWRPRRLGGGLGTSRVGGGEETVWEKQQHGRTSQSEEPTKPREEREKSREKGKERERERSRELSIDQPREREHDRPREDRERDSRRDRGGRESYRERDSRRDRNRDRGDRDRCDRDRGRDRTSRDHDRDRDGRRERDYEGGEYEHEGGGGGRSLDERCGFGLVDEIWDRAVEAALDGQTDRLATRTLTLDGAVKCAQGRLPPPSVLVRFQNLQHLSVANIGLSSLEQFPKLGNLQKLILSDNRIAVGLEFLLEAGLDSLRDLDLSNNRIQFVEDLAPLAKLQLVSLDLYECPVTRVKDYRSRVFGLIKTLKYLDKTDAEGNERPESDDEDDEEDEEDEEEDEEGNERPESDDEDDEEDEEDEEEDEEGNERPESDDEDDEEDEEDEEEDEEGDEEDPGSGEVDGDERTEAPWMSNGHSERLDGVVDVDEDEESDAEDDESEQAAGVNGTSYRANGFRLAVNGEEGEDDGEDSESGEEIDEEEIGEDNDVVEVHEIEDSDNEEDGVDDEEDEEEDDDEEEVDNDDRGLGVPGSTGRAMNAGEIDGHEQGDDDEDNDGETGEDDQGVEDDVDFGDEDDGEEEDEESDEGYLVQSVSQVEDHDAVGSDIEPIYEDNDPDEEEEVEDDLPIPDPSLPSSSRAKRKRDDEDDGEDDDDDDDDDDDGVDDGVDDEEG